MKIYVSTYPSVIEDESGHPRKGQDVLCAVCYSGGGGAQASGRKIVDFETTVILSKARHLMMLYDVLDG